MIIDYPTGSYAPVLPQDPSDSESVVYTISSTTPPRSSLNFIQLPTGIRDEKRVPRNLPAALRRSNLGDLVTISKENKPEQIGIGNQLFYVTQVLDFTGSLPVSIADVNSALETQHDLHYVDAISAGLNTTELNDIAANALESQQQILTELEVLQRQKDDLQVGIVSQQRIVNETNRVIDALNIIIANDPTNQEMKDLLAQVTAKRQIASDTITIYAAELNTMPNSIREKHSQLRSLAVLIN